MSKSPKQMLKGEPSVILPSQQTLSRQMMRNWEVWITNIQKSNNHRMLQQLTFHKQKLFHLHAFRGKTLTLGLPPTMFTRPLYPLNWRLLNLVKILLTLWLGNLLHSSVISGVELMMVVSLFPKKVPGAQRDQVSITFDTVKEILTPFETLYISLVWDKTLKSLVIDLKELEVGQLRKLSTMTVCKLEQGVLNGTYLNPGLGGSLVEMYMCSNTALGRKRKK